jgi:hypothetical protein
MKRVLIPVIVAALAVAVPLSATAAPAAARYVWCGDDGESWNGSAGAFDIWAKRTSCTTARWLGRRWSERAWDEGFPRRVGRFRCLALERHPDPEKVYIGKVLCTSAGGRQAVRFTNTI